ncbi:MAG TPA: GNAT family N-acetyltransferase [Puia sp.]|jgi:phosphinothricin acetyltransferase|nr:GNAT family N-acetyltransferase [Puia sp.]
MISIRLATEDDLPGILSIYNDIILHTTAVYDYQPHSMEMRKTWWASKVKDKYPVFVAAEAEKIVGFSSIGPFRAWAAYKYSVENSVYVATEHRGRGIGKILLPPLITAAIERNLHVIIAGIDASNEASLQLHRHFGFREVAHFREVGYKFGRWLDLKFLELILNTPSNPSEFE